VLFAPLSVDAASPASRDGRQGEPLVAAFPDKFKLYVGLRDGYWYVTSENVAGLLLANSNIAAVLADVPAAINLIAKLSPEQIRAPAATADTGECTCPSGQSGHPHATWCAKGGEAL
jgi:hypothetical protein